jgi:hypothetical protein
VETNFSKKFSCTKVKSWASIGERKRKEGELEAKRYLQGEAKERMRMGNNGCGKETKRRSRVGGLGD